MKNKPILITGCQRSGTTLLHLILDSHPDIHGFDEMEYQESKLQYYLNGDNFPLWVSFKMPIYAPFLDWIKKLLPELKVLWLVRNPHDVVASMMKTPLPLTQTTLVPWPSHPFGGIREVLNFFQSLPSTFTERFYPYMDKFFALSKTNPVAWKKVDAVFVGALCWRIKNELPNLYKLIDIPFLLVPYEKLVTSPKQEISNILAYLPLVWNENVLHHNRLHRGILVGQTDASRPIDSTSIGKWKGTLTEEELHIINDLTSNLAKGYGYEHEQKPPEDE